MQIRQCTVGNDIFLLTYHFVTLLKCYFKVYLYDEHFMQLALNILKLFFS